MRRLSKLDCARLAIFLLICLAALLLGSGKWSPDAYRRVRSALGDWRQVRLLSQMRDPRIAIVDIDERSLDAIGPWPWPRAVLAQLLQNLFEQHHVKAVGLDILLPEPGQAQGDAALLALARNHPLVFAQAFDLSDNAGAPHAGHLAGGSAIVGQARAAMGTPEASGYVANFFDDPGLCAGHVTPWSDQDGVVRSISPSIAYGGRAYPMLAWAVLHCRPTGSEPSVAIDALQTDSRGRLSIPFGRSVQSFDVVPALEVLSGTAPPELLDGRYVLVGSSALGLTDHVATPVGSWLPAVIVHAELVSALLDGTMEGPAAAFGTRLSQLWTACAIVAFGILFRTQRPTFALFVLVATTTLWMAIVAWTRAVPDEFAALPLVPVFVYVLVQAPMEWVSSQAAIRSFERRFSRYLPPVVLKEIVRRRGVAAFEPERRTISVLFADIEGYTRLAERMPPEQLAAMTELVLTRLTQCVRDTDGTLDKYIGDSLMAFWGAPLEQDDHADRALDCACAMLRAIDALNDAELPLIIEEAIHVRIGVNSGSAVVGEIGSTLRQSYTAIGDAINVASRLQDHAKVVQTDLLIGRETARLSTRHAPREFGHATLRGRVAPELIYVLEDARSRACV